VTEELCGEDGCAPFGAEGLDVDCTRLRGHHGDHRIDLGDLGDYTWPQKPLGPVAQPWWWAGSKPVTFQQHVQVAYERMIESLLKAPPPLQREIPRL
jgi:hypothetical protein